ncbi:hypothetical protein DPMN_097630 [Dreissena polymorpha]|uniref:Uncharacterized protein n=1 Tax=Dreissena polymorpha TaxID=45954 RepID=A0A9D4LBK4_DREPO|nr:hypothetical protein DPMN_097630 [Dreissena polymorpha]
MLSSPSAPSQTGFYPLIETVALADTRKSQPPIDYRLRRGPPVANAGSARRVLYGVRGKGRDKRSDGSRARQPGDHASRAR